MNVDAAIEGVQRASECYFCNLLGRDNTADMPKQQLQNIKFNRGQIDRAMATSYGPGTQGHADIADGEGFIVAIPNCRGSLASAPEDGPDPGNQLARIEGLGQVVVGADF